MSPYEKLQKYFHEKFEMGLIGGGAILGTNPNHREVRITKVFPKIWWNILRPGISEYVHISEVLILPSGSENDPCDVHLRIKPKWRVKDEHTRH